MDEFGVLTERFGLKPQGKSAPMAASKRPTNDSGLNLKASSFSSSRSSANSNSDYASFPDDLNGPFQSSSNNKTYSSGGLDDYDDIFSRRPVKPTEQQPQGSSSFNFDSMFSGLNAKPTSFSGYNNDDYDMLGGMPGDIFGSFASSAPKQSAQRAPTNDLLGDLGGVREKLQSLNSNGSNNNRSGKVGKNVADFDDLIPGFGGSTPSNNGTYAPENPPQQSGFRSTQSNFSSEDPFVVLESVSTSTSTAAYSSSDFLSELEQISKASNSGDAKSNNSTTSKVPPKPEQVLNGERSSGVSSIDELEDFAWGRVQNNATGHTNFRSREERVETSATRRSGSSEDDLDFFNMGFRSNSAPRSRVRNLDPVFEAQTSNREGPRPSRTSSATSIFDDFSSVFGASPVFEEFEEVEGESEERRKARQGRHQRAQDRALQAVADMNKRDLQAQQEQEERRRIAETWDNKIKGWSGGKEGNMRALLSTLQCVLWPECGWEPVSLTDLITSSSVKKVFRKAALCFHPDKVQQKGATLEQKYIAEKVFDILKETWNKFNKEELS